MMARPSFWRSAVERARCGVRDHIGIRLTIASLSTSALLTLFVSTLLIYSEFQHQKDAALARFSQIESSYLPSLTKSLWEVNPSGIEALLDGITQLPDVASLTLVDELGTATTKTNNTLPAESLGQKTFALAYPTGDGTLIPLGTLKVELAQDDILQTLRTRASQIGFTLLLTLAANAIIMLIFLRRMITRHLIRIARFTAQFDIDQLDSQLTLKRQTSSLQSDELTVVVNALNTLHQQLKHEFLQRKQTELQLLEYQKTLHQLVDEKTTAYKASATQLAVAASVAGLGVWKLNLPSRTVEWNERMFEIYAQPISENNCVSLNDWTKNLHPEDACQLLAEFNRATEGEYACELKLRLSTQDGGTRFILNKSQTVWGENQYPIAVIGINYDITNQVAREVTLQQSKEQADAENAAKSSFLANMSHEIRTPLNAVLGMLHLVQNTHLNPRQHNFIGKAHASAKLLLALLNDILDYSKIESGKLTLDHHSFSLEALMAELAVVLIGNRGEKNVEVLFDIHPGVPDALIGDALRLKQVLINLAGNALKFTTQGHVVVRIKPQQQSPSHTQLRFEIEDTGIGISPEQRLRIFDGFTQAESSITRRFGGTGLGLVISKKLVEIMGGRLELTSELGKGTCFNFVITLSQEMPQEISHEMPQGMAQDLKQDTQLIAKTPSIQLLKIPTRILIVEDNAIAREIINGILTPQGITCTEAENTATAVHAVLNADQQHQPFDLIIMDWRLPDGDGLECATHIHTLNLSVQPRIIMLSGFDAELLTNHQTQRHTIFSEYLIKPVTPHQLLLSVQRVLTGAPRTLTAPTELQRPQRLAGLRLLVVDDNALNREVAYEMLTDEGAQVELSSGGQEGANMTHAASPPYDAVLMDMQMPEVDGLQATRLIRAEPQSSEVFIIAMTANAAKSDRDLCLAAGMNDHLSKPIDLEVLVAKLLQITQKTATTTKTDTPAHSTATTCESQHAPAINIAPWDKPLIETPATILKRFGNKPERFTRLLNLFASDAKNKMEELKINSQHKNHPACASALHSLKGMSLSMGAILLGERCSHYEHQLNTALQPIHTPLDAIAIELEQLLESTLAELNTINF